MSVLHRVLLQFQQQPSFKKEAIILIPEQAVRMKQPRCMTASYLYHGTERKLGVLVLKITPYGVVSDEVYIYQCGSQPIVLIKLAA